MDVLSALHLSLGYQWLYELLLHNKYQPKKQSCINNQLRFPENSSMTKREQTQTKLSLEPFDRTPFPSFSSPHDPSTTAPLTRSQGLCPWKKEIKNTKTNVEAWI
jgi:hypothetical protein